MAPEQSEADTQSNSNILGRFAFQYAKVVIQDDLTHQERLTNQCQEYLDRLNYGTSFDITGKNEVHADNALSHMRTCLMPVELKRGIYLENQRSDTLNIEYGRTQACKRTKAQVAVHTQQ